MSDAAQVEYTALLRSLTPEKFLEVCAASSRQAKETYFSRHGVRAPKLSSRFPKPGAKNEARVLALFRVLQEHDDDEMAEEILRTFLLSKRPMLCAALDHLGIEHNEGLTDSTDIEKVAELPAAKLKELAGAIGELAAQEDVAIYLKYLGAKNVEQALG